MDVRSEDPEGSRRVLGHDHPSTLTSINNMGVLLHAMGNLEEAQRYYGEALERLRRVRGDDHVSTLRSIYHMGRLLRDLGRLDEAEELGAEAVRGARRSFPEGHLNTGVFLGSHGESLTKLERYT